MDINQANSPEKSEPAVSTTTPDEQLGAPSPARTYECTFCKRGFSNAQALGGHMNIHRKDKARLKQANEPPGHPPQQQQFLEIPKMISSDIPTNILFPQITTKSTLVVRPLEFKAAAAGDHQERSNMWTWNFCTSSDLDHEATSGSSDHQAIRGDHQLIRQLPLFKETVASNPENQKQSEKELSGHDDHELDLELRLGHEPSESSSAAKGTRKFF